jgi:uncharacterized membrane protein (DUF2068 family)
VVASKLPEGRRELALRLIIAGKLTKAIFVLAAAVFFTVLLVTGSSVHLHGLATHLREHVTAAWSVYLSNAIVSATERRHLVVVTSALFLDGLTTSTEWYALRRGHTWGEWLVVIATSSLLPFEVAAVVRHLHVGRVVVLVLNVAIVVYLVRHVLRRRARAEARAATS